MRSIIKKMPIIVSTCLFTGWAVELSAGVLDCGDFSDASMGPFDYTNPPATGELELVNDHHFNADVQSLESGQTSSRLIDDLDYVLRHFPNHHPALYALARLDIRGREPDERYSTRCYFDRAMRFNPDDGTVRMIYGIYLAKKGEREQALQRYEEALELMPESSEAHYNIALLYIELGDFDSANRHAHEAYSLGYPMPGLRNKLERLGQWQQPVPSPRASSMPEQ